MTPPSRVRLTRWGKDHKVEDDGKTTLCGRPVKDTREPGRERLCVQCRKESQRRGMAALQAEMDAKARERQRKLAGQRGAV